MPTTAFISYSHDSGAHVQRVLALADKLRSEGVDVRLDQYVSHPAEGWPRWTQQQVVECDFVLMICTPTYRRRYDRVETPVVGRGTAWEALIADQLMYDAGARNEKLLPVLFEEGVEQDVPLSLRAFARYSLPDEYDALYRRLTGQPLTSAPPLGKVRPMPATPRPSVLERAHFDFRGAIIGSQTIAGGTVNKEPTTIVMPSSAPASQPMSTAPVVESATIVLCTANTVYPRQHLQLEEELRAIEDALRRSQLREHYRIRTSLVATFTQVLRELDDHDPVFVHFSGHGDRSGALILKGEQGGELRVPPARVAELLAELRTQPMLVTFATCHSRVLAEEAARHAAFAIGFDGELEEESAQLFSATLYERLASRVEVEVERSFRLARLACVAAGYESVEQARLFG